MMKRVITVKPLGGLANRMRVLESAFCFAREFQYEVRIIWERSFALNSSFTRLFEIPEHTVLEEFSKSSLAVRSTAFIQGLVRKTGIKVPSGHKYYLVNDDVLNPLKIRGLTAYHDVYIETVHRFADLEGGKTVLKPVHEIQVAVRTVRSRFKGFTLGLHIRRTDNLNSIKYSPIEEFIKIIDDERTRHPDLSIFLATDSRSEEDAIKAHYPGRVICLPKTLDRNHEKGIHDAMMDLYCLSVCDKIIGSYYSSFSEVAALIGNKPLSQVFRDPDK